MKIAYLKALVAARPWLIDEDWMLAFISMLTSGTLKTFDIEGNKDNGAFFGLSGREDAPKLDVISGIGIVPISGPLFSTPNFLTEYLGIGTTYSQILEDVQTHLDNDEVSTILLDCDSPGGVVTSVNETASNLVKAGEIKPLYSYVGGLGASAMYWLMSGSKEIAIDATARVGSIGVVATFENPESDNDLEIVNSASPNKRPDLTTDAGKKVIIEELDALADVFMETVATNRGVSVKTVKTDFGKGGCFVGQKAVDAGMVDKVCFFSDFLEDLKSTDTADDPKSGNSEKANCITTTFNTKKDGFMDVKTLKEQHPEVYKAVVAEGVEKAQEEAKVEIDALKAKNASLEETLQSEKTEKTEVLTRVQALEKDTALRAEKDLLTKAERMIAASLAVSNVPSRLHGKVVAQLDHNKFVVEGKLDEGEYQKAIDAEVAEWEEITSDTGTIQGFSAAADKNEDTAENDDVVDRMAGYLN